MHKHLKFAENDKITPKFSSKQTYLRIKCIIDDEGLKNALKSKKVLRTILLFGIHAVLSCIHKICVHIFYMLVIGRQAPMSSVY